MEGTFLVSRKLLILERETGVEPATSSLGSWHSVSGTDDLHVGSSQCGSCA